MKRIPPYKLSSLRNQFISSWMSHEWTHSAQDNAALVRDFTKWDDMPASLPHFGQSMVRAYHVATTPPYAPTLIVADGELQEREADDPVAIGRGIERAGIGTATDTPNIDFAKMADSMGAWSKGPITDPADLAPALRQASSPLPAAAIAVYIRDPAGEMPPYASKVVGDADVLDIHAYLTSVPAPPKVADIPELN